MPKIDVKPVWETLTDEMFGGGIESLVVPLK